MNSVSCRYKINIQKYFAFFTLLTKLAEKEIKKTIQFTIASKRIKIPRIKFTKDVKHLFSGNFKTLVKEIKDDTNKGKDTPCL